MLEKLKLPDHLIISGVKAEYGLDVTDVTFLPLGYDMNTVVYRVDTTDGAVYFLKLRKGDFNPLTLAVPQFLSSLGIRSIIAPLEIQKGQHFGRLEDYTIILYPFISGKDGYEVWLTDDTWIELGRTLKMVHTSQVQSILAKVIPHEAYDPQWRESVKHFQTRIERVNFNDPHA